MWLAQHLKRRREKCISVILAVMRIYKTCNSVVMSTFSSHNLLKYNIIVLCVCVCVCVYLCRLTNICMYNKSYFRASNLITLVEELDTAPINLGKAIWNAIGTEKPDTLVIRLQQMIQLLPLTIRDCSSLALLALSFSPASP